MDARAVAASTLPWHPFFMVKILGFEKSLSACDWYRLKQPLIHLKASKEAEVRFFYKGNDFDWFASSDAAARLNDAFEWADIIFVPRLNETRLMVVLKEFQKMGKKVVTEWDDDIFNVSPLCQQYGEFGTKEYSHDLNGEKMEVWKDGKNIDIAHNKALLENARDAARMCDMVLTTTEDLANVYRPFNSNVRACPNSINTNLWKKLPLIPHTGTRIGWFGGDTHYQDWLLIAPILGSFMKENPMATLVIMGSKFEGTLKGINSWQIEHHNGVDIAAYPYKAAALDLDFAIIPLVDNDFNNGKSPIKWLEMAALEVPAVTSYVKPYQAMMDLVGDNGIFIEGNSMKGWWEAMNTMINEPLFRKKMGAAARQTVERFYDANNTWRTWLKAFEECVKKEPVKLEVVA